jgi:translocation protein SEC63
MLTLQLKVEDPPADAEYDSDDDISEPDEDTLAGQMAMMRGGKVKPSAVHDRGDESDEESGSEDEYESSSDEEGPKGRRPGKAINEDSSDED